MEAFQTNSIPPKINKTYICLVLKIKNPEQITHYRPISLCNTIYKVITKIIVNKIRPYLDKIISPNQCSFISGRRAVDNAIIVQEAIHFFKKTKGSFGKMLLKIDLEKTFDRLEWSFIQQSLHILNFPTNLINLIMSCVSSSSISILINEKPTNYFLPSRGIRQGDLLSPYISIICMESLSRLINYAIQERHWQPIKIGRIGTPISHLLFADDIILMAKADIMNANSIISIVNTLARQSGQNINFNKSFVFLSPNVSLETRILSPHQ